MQYVFLIYLDEKANLARTEAEIKISMASHTPYIDMLRRNGQYVASDALGAPHTARTLRTSSGKPVATEGPFAESREQLGGFYVVDAKDLDEAIALASSCPAMKTVAVAIEIRPMPAALPRSGGSPGDHRYMLALYGDDAALGGDDGGAGPPFTKLSPPGSATTLRLVDGKIALSDGPFADGREQLRGVCIVSADDLDAAVRLAAEAADARRGAIEVRSIRTPVM